MASMFNTPTFTPSNWYWKVGADLTQVYSSAAVGYVPVTDPTYVAWKQKTGGVTKIDAEQSLWDVLIPLGVAVPAGKTTSDAQKTALVTGITLVIGRVLFNHENRIRALETKAPITMQQFITGVKALLP
jgi:hypothetical protein